MASPTLKRAAPSTTRGKVGDRERIAEEIRATLPLLLDPVQRGVHDGAIGLELRVADLVTKAIVRRKNPPQRPQRLIDPGEVSDAP